MLHIFISYRRQDSRDITGRLYDRLKDRFGVENVFMDVSNIDPGQPFAEEIKKQIERSNVMLVIIGSHWVTYWDRCLCRKLFRRNDWVRTEIEIGLKNGLVMIPVTVDGARIPRPSQLPANIRSLLDRQQAEIRSGGKFPQDANSLIEKLQSVGDPDLAPADVQKFTSTCNIYRLLIRLVMLGVLIVVLWFIVPPPPPPPTPTPAITQSSLLVATSTGIPSPTATPQPTSTPITPPTHTPTNSPSPTHDPAEPWITFEVRGNYVTGEVGPKTYCDSSRYKVILYAGLKEADHWFIQLFGSGDQGNITIKSDCTWKSDTHDWDILAAHLVDASFDPPDSPSRLGCPPLDPDRNAQVWAAFCFSKPD